MHQGFVGMVLKQFLKRGQGGFFSEKPQSCIYFFLTSLVGELGDISSLYRTSFAFFYSKIRRDTMVHELCAFRLLIHSFPPNTEPSFLLSHKI